MPAPERSDLLQYAILWPILAVIDGEPKLGPVVELAPPTNGVRWNSSRSEAKDSKGQKVSLDATAVVNQKIDVDSLIWLGSLAEWYGTGSGTSSVPDTEVMQVVSYKEVPDLKNRESMKTIGMMRWMGASPS